MVRPSTPNQACGPPIHSIGFIHPISPSRICVCGPSYLESLCPARHAQAWSAPVAYAAARPSRLRGIKRAPCAAASSQYPHAAQGYCVLPRSQDGAFDAPQNRASSALLGCA